MCSNDKLTLNCIPVLYARGTHYDLGKCIGTTFKAMIKGLLSTWGYFNDAVWGAYCKEEGKKMYNQCLEHCRKKFPQYIEEIRGMADGSQVPFEKLFLVNMDSIITASDSNAVDMEKDATGCSSIMVNGPKVIIGHTEDTMKEISNRIYIVSCEVLNSDGDTIEKFTSLSYAGHLVGYTMGFSSTMAYSVNTLFPKVHKLGTPSSFIARALLTAQNLEDAVGILKDCGHGVADGFSLNVYFSKTPRLMYNIEVVPPISGTTGGDDAVTESLVHVHTVKQGESYFHCNMYRRLKVEGEKDLPIELSSQRQLRIQSVLNSTLNGVKDILSDQSNPKYPIYIDHLTNDAPSSRISFLKTVAVGIFDFERNVWSLYLDKPNCTKSILELSMNF